MPDVISLLSSSPELPLSRAIDKTSQSFLPSGKLHYKASKSRDNNFIDLSSGCADVDLFLPPTKNTPNASASADRQLKVDSNATSRPPPSRHVSVPSNSIFFNSDDFDSTVNLDDDAFASDQPPVKRRKASPTQISPMITGSPRHRKWSGEYQKLTQSHATAELLEQGATSAASYNYGTSSRSYQPKINPELLKNDDPRTLGYRRSSSDLGGSAKFTAPRQSAARLPRSKTMGAILESDPIVFTSSPDPVTEARKLKQKQVNIKASVISENTSDDDVFASSPHKVAKGKMKSTDSALETSRRDNALRLSVLESSDIELPDLGAITSQPNQNNASKSRVSAKYSAMAALSQYEAEKEKEKKRGDRKQMAKDKLAAKEAEKEQKRIAKEEKVREKDKAAELAKVNILRTDKKKSTPEMIVDLPSCLEKKFAEQIQTFLKPVEAEHTQYENSQPILKWRRKIDSEFDNIAGHWEKVAAYVGDETHVMCILKAQEFVGLATGEAGSDMDSHVLQLKAGFPMNDIIYLIEGLEPWMRKNKNLQNRKYLHDVRNQMPGDILAPVTVQKRKKRPGAEYVDEDLLEDVLLRLQVMHGVLIHHTKVQIETAEWIVIFTQHISTIRYRVQRQALDTAFCMESGQVKPGDGPADTFTKMLQEMVRITASVAYGIAAEYPTVQKLVRGLKEKGPLALQDCKKSANKNGAFTDRRVGPSISKRVYNVFVCRNAESWDV